MRCSLVRAAKVACVLALPSFISINAQASEAVVRPGDKTVSQVCSTCHGMGIMGAPKIGDTSAWTGRLKAAGSVDQLAESAEHGKGNMPARGGMSSLTDADLKAAITYMLGKSNVELSASQ